MCRVRYGEGLIASVGLHGRNVKDEVEIADPLTGAGASGQTAVLSCGVACPARVQVLFRDFDLAAHRFLFACVDAMSQRVFDEYLGVVAFPGLVNKWMKRVFDAPLMQLAQNKEPELKATHCRFNAAALDSNPDFIK